jgi:uncharacterized membrane protein YdfJ with MMPL/SSD domain
MSERGRCFRLGESLTMIRCGYAFAEMYLSTSKGKPSKEVLLRGLATAQGAAKHLHDRLKDTPSTKPAANAARSLSEHARKLIKAVKTGPVRKGLAKEMLGRVDRLDKILREMCSNGSGRWA